MNKSVRRIANNYMKKADEITVGNKNKGADNVQHFYYVVHEKDRYQALRRIADVNPDIHGIVFCRTRRETQKIADQLIKDHYSAEAIHGEIAQSQRTKVMDRFRKKNVQLLVATDVAARGIDVSGLTHIINYNLTEKTEAYVHRSGRTGRANNSGISLVIVNMREQYKIKLLEREIGKGFEKGRIPSGEDICEKQLFKLVDKVCNIKVNEEQIGKYLGVISKKFEHMSRDELIKKLVSEEFNRFLKHYQGATDLNTNVSSGRGQRSNKSSILFARFNINVGRKEELTVKELMGFINSQPTLKNVEIGKISLNKSYTLFEIDERYKNQVLDCFNNTDIDGIPVTIYCEETGLQSSREEDGRGGRDRGRGKKRPYYKKGGKKRLR